MKTLITIILCCLCGSSFADDRNAKRNLLKQGLLKGEPTLKTPASGEKLIPVVK